MDPTKPDHDASADTGSSRPDDPAVLAAAAGKTSDNQRPYEPSQQHIGDDDESVERLAGDVLLGAKSIAEHITALGFPVNETDVYYLHRAKKWPFNKYGVFLIASKRRLTRHAENLLRGSAAV
jgi:hypothetical protein